MGFKAGLGENTTTGMQRAGLANAIRELWPSTGGPLVTALAALLLDLVARNLFHVPEPSAFILLAVVYASFSGGLRSGLASAGIAWMFYAYHFSKPNEPFQYTPADFQRVIVLAAVTPAVAVLAGVLHRRAVTQRIRASEGRFKAFMDNSPAVAWMRDAQGRYVYVNQPFLLTFNLALDGILGRSDVQVWSPEASRQLMENDQAILASGKPLQLYDTVSDRDGRRQYWWILQFPLDTEGDRKFTGGMAVDVTERRQAEEALRASEERYALAAQSVNDGLWDWNLKLNEVYFSNRWKSMLGFEDGDIGRDPDEWFKRVHPDDLPNVRQALESHLEGRTPVFESEHRIRHKDRGYRWVLSRGLAVRNGDESPYRMVGAQTDTTERKLAEEQLIHDALHDALTGLPNRALFLDRLRHRIDVARRRKDKRFAVLFLDLDRFKVVNDSLGHLRGDELLVETARRLETSVRPSDTVARLGGDEFAILLEDVIDISRAVHVAERIQATLRAPFRLGTQNFVTTASIGIALSETGYEKAEDVLRDADTAMYRAKSDGRARHEVFDRTMHANAMVLLQLESDMRAALERSEFVPYYMPIVSLETGRIAGFEALVRWRHPQRGIVPPMEFIGVAEESNLVVPIDRLVMRKAAQQLKAWQDRFENPDLTMSVNLSGRQFRHADLAEQVERALKDADLDGRSLAVEITENVLIEETETATQVLGHIRKLGVKTYLDDFGTGYSSLSYLHRFPIDTVKIDRSFVSRMGPKKEDHEIVRAIVQLAQNLGIGVVAEGVENASHLSLLRALKCTYGQGWLFSKPIPAEDAERLLGEEPRW